MKVRMSEVYSKVVNADMIDRTATGVGKDAEEIAASGIVPAETGDDEKQGEIYDDCRKDYNRCHSA